MRSNQYYAAIDLGSNSFHMLVVRVVAGSVQIVSKIKRKIRLAEGLTSDNTLDQAAQQRALECLAIFADRVNDIAPENIKAVGTAALRKLDKDDPFLAQMQETLGHPIQIISGETEAKTIYQGIAHTTMTQAELLVCDIGGASTELALGLGFESQQVVSLDMGCVTWMTRYFPAGVIRKENADAAIEAACALIRPHQERFVISEQARILGASGTFKALQEIAQERGRSERFTLPWLESLLTEVTAFANLDAVQMHGLKPDRTLVFLPGLCVLIALFRTLGITHIEATEAALREGLIYGMLTKLQHEDVQLRTLKSLAEHYHADLSQTERVHQLYQRFANAIPSSTNLQSDGALARAVAYLHEIGLSLSYKQAGRHSRYLLKHTNLPGFSLTEREELLSVLQGVGGIIDDDKAPENLPSEPHLAQLSRLLRIAIIACQRRRDDAVPHCSISLTQVDERCQLTLHLPHGFLQTNPYLASLLQEESRFQQRFGGLELKESA